MGKTQDAVPAGPSATSQRASPQRRETLPEVDDPETRDGSISVDGFDMTKGAKLTLSFNDGLVVTILPNGDIAQQPIAPVPLSKSQTKGNHLLQDPVSETTKEVKRIITADGHVIRYLADGNFVVYFIDGTITYSDNRKRTWYTINEHGVKRARRLQEGTVSDELERLKTQTKVDPETNAQVTIREDRLLRVEYID